VPGVHYCLIAIVAICKLLATDPYNECTEGWVYEMMSVRKKAYSLAKVHRVSLTLCVTYIYRRHDFISTRDGKMVKHIQILHLA
jgi:hypothetical protein